MAAERILSIGIDIGTSTTQVIFSRLTMENTAGYFTVPRVAIVGKEVVYKGAVHTTPLLDASHIDGDAVRSIVEDEYRLAGFNTSDVSTGAVIITGEAARKDNSALVLSKLSDFAGEFVVSTAGPDLEAVVAGKGSGAWQFSVDSALPTVNIDIGGGTSNIVFFRDGETAARGCVDIGGRQIRVDGDMTVSYISPSAALIAEDCGVSLSTGGRTSEEELRQVCGRMARLLWEFIAGRSSALLERVTTAGSSPYTPPSAPRAVFFSGGVADCIYSPPDSLFAYGDIGVLLGQEIKASPEFNAYRVVRPGETIRATVVGAGSYTTTVSGSTIFYSAPLFPQKNLPVLKLTLAEQAPLFTGDFSELAKKLRWFFEQTDSDNILLALPGVRDPGYGELKLLAAAVAGAVEQVFRPGEPLFLSVETDMAKALGQTVKAMMPGRETVCFDSVRVEQNDYVDLGRPLMGGIVIPVVVKTLIFG